MSRSMAEKVMGFLFVLFGVFVIYESSKMSYVGQASIPGPGFLPVWLGGVLLLCSFIILWGAFRAPESNTRVLWETGQLKRPALMLLAILIAVILFPKLGSLLTLGLFLAVTLKWLGRNKWITVAGVSIGLPILVFLLFDVLLNIPLPKGILGI